ncbi:MAG: histidine kinase N-terminal 7TM domain-containing protein [Patescibacteria group bacterium]|nr:histidine kinase N-terminal 7TM domain-containing protein [Patescibacteria group bacterium]MDD4610985.1 histidine kinase N-terminal 7TM domain-containing protein [Patescibacteria group bacterium]
MNFFAFTGLFTSIFCLGLIILMIFKSKTKAHYLFIFFCASVVLWEFGAYRLAITLDPEKALYWWHVAYAGVIFTAVFNLHFILAFLNLSKKLLLYIIYAVALFFSFLNIFTDKFIDKVTFKFDQFYYLGPPTIIYSIWLLTFLATIIYAYALLAIYYKKSSGIRKIQIKYFFLAILMGFGMGSFDFLPVYNINLYPYLNITGALFALTLYYAIIRYRLLNIRLAIQKGFGYALSVFFLLLMYFSLFWSIGKIFSAANGRIPLISAGITMLVGIFSAEPLAKFYRKITDPIFFRDRYHYSEVISSLNETINREIELDIMMDKTFKIISDALKIEKIVFLLFDDKIKKFVSKKDVGFPVSLQFELSNASSLAQYLNKIKEAVIAEELEIKLEDKIIPDSRYMLAKKVVKKLKDWGVGLCQPVIKQNKMIAIVCVGEKLSGDAFSSEDLRLIKAFAHQVVIAMQNFVIYKELKDRNIELEKNLKLMAGRELKMMELKSRIKELEDART